MEGWKVVHGQEAGSCTSKNASLLTAKPDQIIEKAGRWKGFGVVHVDHTEIMPRLSTTAACQVSPSPQLLPQATSSSQRPETKAQAQPCATPSAFARNHVRTATLTCSAALAAWDLAALPSASNPTSSRFSSCTSNSKSSCHVTTRVGARLSMHTATRAL